MYELILADGTTISNLTMNGTNFVSETEVDESLFDNNLSTLTIRNTEDDTEEVWNNCEFIQQIHYDNFHGNTGYYFCFREMSEEEIQYETISGKLDYLAMMSDIDLEEV